MSLDHTDEIVETLYEDTVGRYEGQKMRHTFGFDNNFRKQHANKVLT